MHSLSSVDPASASALFCAFVECRFEVHQHEFVFGASQSALDVDELFERQHVNLETTDV